MVNCSSRTQGDYIPVTMEMSASDNAIDVFINSNYFFLSKYNDPDFEPYGPNHWTSTDSTLVENRLTIRRVSNCNEETLDNEHFNFFGKCIQQQVIVVDTKINKTIELSIQTSAGKRSVDFRYDNIGRILEIEDSTSETNYHFLYSDDELKEIEEIDSKGEERIQSIIRFKRV
jgi:hypothetical protein